MKKLLLTTIALSGMFLFVSCGEQASETETEQELNEEIIQETEDDLLDRIEEEEADKNQEEDIIEKEEIEGNKAQEGVTEVEVKTLKN